MDLLLLAFCFETASGTSKTISYEPNLAKQARAPCCSKLVTLRKYGMHQHSVVLQLGQSRISCVATCYLVVFQDILVVHDTWSMLLSL